MEASALAELAHENWIAYLESSISLNPDGLVRRDRGIVALLGHVPLRFFNQVLVEEPDAAEAAVRDAAALCRERSTLFSVSLRHDADERFMPLMADLGLVAADEALTRAMALHPLRGRREPRNPSPAFEIRRIDDAAGLADHRMTVSEGFGSDASVAEAMMGIGLLDRREAAVYVGYASGKPVTSGFGWRTGRTIGVYNIATIPESRRNGFGEAMTARVLADGEAAGCDVAILQASPMGRPIYERLGFRVVMRYTGFIDPALSSHHHVPATG